MRKRTKMLAGILAAVLVVGSLAGCGGGGDDKKSSGSDGAKSSGAEKVFNYSTNSVVIGLNPIMNTTQPDNEAHNLICDPLVRDVAAKDNTNESIPAAAESWEVSEDGLTWTFKIHENAKWSDGEPLTANDFEYTLKLMADPNTAAVNAWLFDGVIENFGEALYNNGKTPDEIGVKAVDDKTLEIKLVHPASYFIELAGGIYPVRQDKYEEWGDKYGSSADKIICSGPFKVESWDQNTELVCVKNENYWDAENVKLDKVVQKVIQETSTAVQAFINGEIDVIGTSDSNWIKTVEAADMSNTSTVPDEAPEFLMFNVKNQYLSNAKIRQAISAAIDREALVEAIWDGRGIPLYSVMPDTMKVGEEIYTELVDGKNYFVKDLQEQGPKALLEEGMKELGISDPSEITVNYASRGTTELSKKMAEWYKQTWEEKLGITVQIDMMEWNIMWDKIDAGDYDIANGGWGPYYNEPSAVLTLFDPHNGYFNAKKTGWDNEDSKKFKELCESAKFVVDDKEKAEIYLQAEELLVKNALIAPVFLYESPTFTAKYVKDYFVSTEGYRNWARIDVEK